MFFLDSFLLISILDTSLEAIVRLNSEGGLSQLLLCILMLNN